MFRSSTELSSQIRRDRQLSKRADPCASGVTAGYTTQSRSDRSSRDTEQLPDDLAKIESTPPDAEHAHVGKHMRPYVPLSENVSAFEMYEGEREILLGESAPSGLHLCVESGA
jgi:hypothetical protein